MIKVIGTLTMRGDYVVHLDMTEEDFDALSEQEQNDEINDAVDWRNWIENAEIHDIDVDDVK